MNKLLKVFVLTVVIFFGAYTFSYAQTPSPTPEGEMMEMEEISSFDMFWPVVAGKVKGDTFYGIKLFKEKLREIIIFSDYRKADYNITLSVKRVVESEKLYLTDKKYDRAEETLKAAEQKRQRVLDLIAKVEGKGQKTIDLKNTLKSSLEKQAKLLVSIKSQVPDDKKQAIEDDLNSMQEILPKLQ